MCTRNYVRRRSPIAAVISVHKAKGIDNELIIIRNIHPYLSYMVGVAQLVRAPGCGPGGRGFKPHHSPLIKE